jgi:tRNA (cytidine/uridine-2'-O-)-methyltransferase
MINIVLLEPEIPQNTANIGRTCVCCGCALHLIKPLGFSVDEKAVRRAGLDYWPKLRLSIYENLEDFMITNNYPPLVMLSTKARRRYDEYAYKDGDFIMFGKESAGIPAELLRSNEERVLRIPMSENCRSLNLGSSAAIVLYEALRQNGFPGLETKSGFFDK